jgi:hypothetical protein
MMLVLNVIVSHLQSGILHHKPQRSGLAFHLPNLPAVQTDVTLSTALLWSIFNAGSFPLTYGSASLAFVLLLAFLRMTEQLQSDLSELEKLKVIRIAINDDGQSFFIGFSYQRESPGEKVFAWICWMAVAVLYGICGLLLWGAVT